MFIELLIYRNKAIILLLRTCDILLKQRVWLKLFDFESRSRYKVFKKIPTLLLYLPKKIRKNITVIKLSFITTSPILKKLGQFYVDISRILATSVLIFRVFYSINRAKGSNNEIIQFLWNVIKRLKR